jgi:hypothetical protein
VAETLRSGLMLPIGTSASDHLPSSARRANCSVRR